MNPYRAQSVPALASPAASEQKPRRSRSWRKPIVALSIPLAIIACGGGLTNQAIDTATAVAQCVAPIVLDVTGQASTDPAQIAQSCKVAIEDVYNFVVAEIAAAQNGTTMASVAADAGPSGSRTILGSNGRYYTEAQVTRMETLRDKAAVLLGKSVGQPAKK